MSAITRIKSGAIGLVAVLSAVQTGIPRSQNSDWTSQSPPATSGKLNEVCFADANTLYAVGDFGLILKSIDGGSSWSGLTSNNSNNLRDVFFADPLTGWAVGSNGVILKTTDGGNAWILQTSGTSKILTAVHFISPLKGWAVGWDKTVLKTTDGGDHWIAQGSTVSLTFFEDVQFLDENNGFAAGHGGGHFFRTVNGGQTWTPSDIGAGWLKKVHFTDALHGWAAGITAANITVSSNDESGITIRVDGELPKVWKTADGGLTWNPTVLGASGWLRDVHFSDNLNGWAAGDNGILASTTNGGSTWTPADNPFGVASILNAVAASGASKACAVGDQGVILTSAGAGSAWDVRSGSGTGNYLAACHFLDSQRGWAVGGGGVIVKTENGGQVWTAQSAGSAIQWTDVFFVDANRGWITGQGGRLYHTTNGGTQWKDQYPPYVSHIYKSYNSVQFPDALNGWVVGDEGLILHTDDGGTHWSPQTSGTQNNLNSCRFLDVLHGWAVGDGGVILETSNGGSTWSLKTVTNKNLNSVFFLNETTGWACGSPAFLERGNVILYTADGGDTWNPQYNGPDDPLKSIYFADANNGWAAGTGETGMILRTTDGGRNWGSQASGLEKDSWGRTFTFNDIFFTSGSTGWVMGDNGVILKTASGGGAFYFAPVLVSPADLAGNQPLSLTLAWTAVTGAVSYDVLLWSGSIQNPVADRKGLTATSVAVSGLQHDAYYQWRVRANYATGSSLWSVTRQFLTLPAPVFQRTALVSPADYAVDVSVSPTLVWTAVPGAVGYDLQVATEREFLNLVINRTGLTGASYAAGGLDYTERYYWRVRVTYAGGTSAWTDSWFFRTLSAPPPPPAAPDLRDPGNHLSFQDLPILLRWYPVTGSLSTITYQYQVSTDPGFSQIAASDSNLTETEHSCENLDYSTRYFWRVRAKNSAGFSEYSSVCEFTTRPKDWRRCQSAYDRFRSIQFADETEGWTRGLTKVYHTTDGGETWPIQYSTEGSIESQFLSDLWFQGDRTGWLVKQDGAVLKTEDGADQWIGQTIETGMVFRSVCFTDPMNGWLSGRDAQYGGQVFRTTDGGVTWNKRNEARLSVSERVLFCDAQNGYLYEQRPSLFKTTDAGSTWERLSLNVPLGLLNDLCFISPNVGWIAGALEESSWLARTGRLLKTEDGGRNWAEQANTTEGQFNSVFFLDAERGLAVGDSGLCMSTKDGGGHWERQDLGITENLLSVFFLNPGTGWIGGQGLILKTTSGGGIVNVDEIGGPSVPKPSTLDLRQNYPNPFNASTLIQVEIPKTLNVRVAVYNTSGERISLLHEGVAPAGIHRYRFDAAGLSSGLYICRLEAGAERISRKMFLLK